MEEPDRTPASGIERRVHRLEFTVEWPPGHSAAYLLDGDEPVLVDAGMPGDDARSELAAELAASRCDPGDVDHLLLTHAHRDHIGQVRTLLENGSPTVYAPREIATRYERDIETVAAATRTNLVEAGVDDDVLDTATERLVGFHRTIRTLLPLEAVDVWLDHGTPIDVGPLEVEPIHAPGHHVSQYCYRTELDGERALFSGDVAMEPFRAPALLVNFDDGVRESVTTFLESLRRIRSADVDRVYPGHGPVHSEYEAMVARSIADIESRLEETAESVSVDGTTAFGLAASRAGRKHDIERLLVETVGMLAHLETEGRLDSRLEDGVRYYVPA
ncbi:MBL fold metallo-hydrolase [Natronolimnohabitans innermongolicus]|uniref:Hydrolase (Hydroxyacylglutathione hydrolase) 11 n=1 Tax=Natronolimnohabitans innermongolicus JCM 12255 TaxID=1227499 RepID=L9WLY7_9EURY|nr:MBL fold metallo-hydrolase [Natronolimnohabitans innermongolicus]ELY50397.1 hydrolase (hydroxyacylglutathione hydrolase) 11 [Natronolimnohabitans innermongolicus JCM 12255]